MMSYLKSRRPSLLTLCVLAATVLSFGAFAAPARSATQPADKSWNVVYSASAGDWHEYVDGMAVTAIATTRPALAIGAELLRGAVFRGQEPLRVYRLSYSGTDNAGLSFELRDAAVSERAVTDYRSRMGANPHLLIARDFALFLIPDIIATLDAAPARMVRTSHPPTEMHLTFERVSVTLSIDALDGVVFPIALK